MCQPVLGLSPRIIRRLLPLAADSTRRKSPQPDLVLLVTTSRAPVTTSDALVTNSFLLLLVRHLLLLVRHLLLLVRHLFLRVLNMSSIRWGCCMFHRQLPIHNDYIGSASGQAPPCQSHKRVSISRSRAHRSQKITLRVGLELFVPSFFEHCS